jgi:hypothetical protein
MGLSSSGKRTGCLPENGSSILLSLAKFHFASADCEYVGAGCEPVFSWVQLPSSNATVAQSAEHSPCKRAVVGATPTCSSRLGGLWKRN